MFQGFTWIGALYSLAKAGVLLGTVLAGRVLGPAEYGKVNVVLALSTFLTIVMVMGFPLAIAKLIAEERDVLVQRRIASTAVASFLVWSLAVCAPLLLLVPALAAWLGLSRALVGGALAYSALNALHCVFAAPMLGDSRFSQRGFVEAAYGLSVPFTVGAGLLCIGASHGAVIAGLCASFGLGAALSAGLQAPRLRGGFDPASFERIWRYALLGALILLSTALVVAPARLILNRHFSPREVGVFSAYFNSTAQVALTGLHMLVSVVVPVASRYPGGLPSGQRFRRCAPAAVLALWAAFAAVGALGLAAFGKHEYPFRLDWLLLFSAAAAAILVHGFATAVLSARDFRGLCLSVGGALIAGLVNLLLGALLIPRASVSAAAISLLAAYAVALGYYALLWPASGSRSGQP